LPSDGQRVRFTWADSWLGGWTDHDPDDAVLEVARFLAATGPATRPAAPLPPLPHAVLPRRCRSLPRG
jgi:hypothetical protein